MFEKEANEYAKENKKVYGSDEYADITDYNNVKKAFQKGAEFGYNKANEWHKQDIDDIYDFISKDWEDKYFICIMKDKSRITAIGNCYKGNNGEVSVNLLFEYDDEKYYWDDIVWWREIKLPTEDE